MDVFLKSVVYVLCTVCVFSKDATQEQPSGKALATKAQNKCTDSGYSTFYDSTHACYKLHLELATWKEARAACAREGGDLAVVNSAAEARVLQDILAGKVIRGFVGFSWDNDSWLTIHGQTLSEAGFERWATGVPHNAGRYRNCGAMYADGTFDNFECYNKIPFLCEIAVQDSAISEQESSSAQPVALSVPQNKCDGEYVQFEKTRSCYKIHTEKVMWYTAFATCAREGAHLAIINDKDEVAAFVRRYPEGVGRWWLGFGLWKDGVWLTIQGQTFEEAGYGDWADGEPNNIGGKQFCGCMYDNGGLDDLHCDDLQEFICEKELS